MQLTYRELWTVLHGMVFGAFYLLAFGGGLAGLYSLQPAWVSAEGAVERVRRLKIGLWSMAAASWLTVISGSWVVYIWYRAKPPVGANLTDYPKALLVSKAATAGWHNLGMEWKEHIAWLAPILITAAAYLVQRYGKHLVNMSQVRRIVIALLAASFAAAAVAGALGAFINKAAPTR